ncbi:MAG: putative sensory box/GGDEF family protein [Frankiales bacterium]|nr:putative sensory box/GGDEF family protein [Frankiales bacterium]
MGPDHARAVLLLVEDDADYAGLVRLTCEAGDLALPVVHVSCAREAMLRLALGDVRCVLLDLSLPDARGMDALHLLRELDPHVPVVVLTGQDADGIGVSALQAGAQDFLVKGQHPPDAVTRAIRFALERADRQAAERRQEQLDDRLQLREAQLSEAQRLARIGSWEWDLVSGEVLWSEELQRLTGLADVDGEEAFGRYLGLVAEEDRPQAARLFSIEAAQDPPVVVRHRLVRRDGTRRWVQGHMTAAGWAEDGEPVRVIGTMQDVTEQKHAEDLLAHQALHDSLTGLVKREVLLHRLERVLAEPQADGSLVAVVFLDLDRFKWVNDSRSHAAGDRLLVGVARALERALRPTDTLARFGGDEFVVLCERVQGEQDVLHIVQRLARAVERPVLLGGMPDPSLAGVQVTASLGVATALHGVHADAEALVRDADIAMYRAKERGRARFEVFDEDMRERATARLQTQGELTAALAGEQLQVHYQPVVDPRTGIVSGTEALVRWAHPERGLLLPDEFVPHAEETGLIVGVGAAVLAEACATTAAWNRARTSALTVAVNLSARQLSDPRLVDVVAEALERSGLPPHLLCLEVTETVVMEDAAASARVLARLRTVGVHIAIDDFGTGYSSLAYLLSLPVDLLKVDRSFVAAVTDDGPGAAIVTAVIALARTLGLGVVAEGVETLAQRGTLVDLGVGSAQGWLWGRAVPAEEADWVQALGPAGDVPPLLVELPVSRRPSSGEGRAPQRPRVPGRS